MIMHGRTAPKQNAFGG